MIVRHIKINLHQISNNFSYWNQLQYEDDHQKYRLPKYDLVHQSRFEKDQIEYHYSDKHKHLNHHTQLLNINDLMSF